MNRQMYKFWQWYIHIFQVFFNTLIFLDGQFEHSLVQQKEDAFVQFRWVVICNWGFSLCPTIFGSGGMSWGSVILRLLCWGEAVKVNFARSCQLNKGSWPQGNYSVIYSTVDVNDDLLVSIRHCVGTGVGIEENACEL